MLLRHCVKSGLVAAAMVLGVNASALAQDEAGSDAGTSTSEVNTEVKTTEEAPAAEVSSESSGKGLLGDWRVGPTFNVAILPPSVGIEVMYKNTFSAGFHVGPFTYKSDDVDLKFNSWDLVGRWHPWMGSFFVGLGYVSQDLDLEAKSSIDAGAGQKVPTKLKVGVTTNYLMPHIGWMSVWDSGFTLGFEIGYKMHSSHSTDKLKVSFDGATTAQEAAVVASEDYKKLKKDVDDAAETFGEMGMPYINLLKIGYLF